MEAFIIKLVGSAVLGAILKGVVAASGHSIAWGWALLIGFVVVFGGVLILGGDVID